MAIRTRLGRLFRNNGFILALALVIGLGFGHGASFTRATVTPGLAVIMTLSLMGVSSTIFSDFRKLLVPTLLAVLLNYVVLSGAAVISTIHWLVQSLRMSWHSSWPRSFVPCFWGQIFSSRSNCL